MAFLISSPLFQKYYSGSFFPLAIVNYYKYIRQLVFEYHPRFVNKSLDDLLKVLGKDYRGYENLGIMHCVRK